MTKKLVIIAGIIGLATIAAAAVAFFLTRPSRKPSTAKKTTRSDLCDPSKPPC